MVVFSASRELTMTEIPSNIIAMCGNVSQSAIPCSSCEGDTIPGDATKMGGYIWHKKAMVQHFGLGPNSSQAFDRDDGAASRFSSKTIGIAIKNC
jgi:hypothetical protein